MSDQFKCRDCVSRSRSYWQEPCASCRPDVPSMSKYRQHNSSAGSITYVSAEELAALTEEARQTGANIPKADTGGSVSYYTVMVHKPLSGDPAYAAECNDLIEALGMNYAEGNAFKAIWRLCAARGGKAKTSYPGGVYDAEKVVFFGKRMVEQQKFLKTLPLKKE